MTKKSTEFIQGRLSDIFNSLPGISFRYQFKDHLNTHIIEVLPFGVYENDRAYIGQEIVLQEEFDGLFPSEEILFVYSKSLNKVEKPTFELKSDE